MHDLLNHLPIPVGLIFALLAFVMFWRLIMRVLRRASRMNDIIPADAGPVLRTSVYGDAVINGTRAGNSVRLVEHANGLAVQMHPLFGSGLVWLPRSDTVQRRNEANTVALGNGKHIVLLTGQLADFMADTADSASAPHAHPPHVHRTTPDTDHSHATALATGLQRIPRGTAGSALSRLAIGFAIALLLYVLVRRTAPEWVEPLERLVTDLIQGL